MSVNGHIHTISGHSHNLVFNIFEESNTPTITLYTSNNGIDFTSFDSYSTNQLELDLTARFSSTGWKALKFETTARCRIDAILVLKLDIDA